MSIWSDPNTFWLNVTNIVLGVVTLGCIVLVGQAAFRDILERVMQRAGNRQPDLHALEVGELGLTMADGGEPVQPNDERKK